jgi:hypothetical protein
LLPPHVCLSRIAHSKVFMVRTSLGAESVNDERPLNPAQVEPGIVTLNFLSLSLFHGDDKKLSHPNPADISMQTDSTEGGTPYACQFW